MGKQPFLVLSICMVFALSAPASEMSVLIKQTSMQGEDSYEIMSQKDYTALTKRLRMEAALARQAHALAEKDWDENSLPGRYPGRELTIRRTQKLLSSTDQERLEKKKGQAEASEAAAAEKRAANKNAWKKQGTGGKNDKGNFQKARAEKEKREAAKEEKRQILVSHAAHYFVQHLNKLVDEKAKDLGYAQEVPQPKPLPKEKEKAEPEKSVRRVGGGPGRATGAESILGRDLKMK